MGSWFASSVVKKELKVTHMSQKEKEVMTVRWYEAES